MNGAVLPVSTGGIGAVELDDADTGTDGVEDGGDGDDARRFGC